MKTVYIWARQSTDSQTPASVQAEIGEAYAKQHDLQIVGRSVFTGSTWESDATVFFDEMLGRGITAYHDVMAALKSGRVDYLWAHEKTRLGRAPWLYLTLVEEATRNGCTVVFDSGDMINAANMGTTGIVSAIGSRADVQRMHSKVAYATYTRRVKAGQARQGNIPWTHMLDDGDPPKLIVNPSVRIIVHEATQMLLSGESFIQIGCYLRDKYPQFENLTIPDNKVKRLFFNPISHGNTAISAHQKGKYKTRYGKHTALSSKPGAWGFDADAPDKPDGVILFEGTCQALWEGEEHERVKDVLRKRRGVNGRWNQRRTRNPFAGILVCDECGYSLRYRGMEKQKDGSYRYEYIYCESHRPPRNTGCSNRQQVRMDIIRNWFDKIIRQALREGVFFFDLFDTSESAQWQKEVAMLQAELIHQQDVIHMAVRKMEQFPTSTAFDTTFEQAHKRVNELQAQLVQLKAHQPQDIHTAKLAWEQIEAGIDTLWELPPGEINRILKRAMGGYQLRVYGTEIRY